jgi:hypothetical protein
MRPIPGIQALRAAASLPIWSCSGRGLPCGHLFRPARWALTPPFHPYHGFFQIHGGLFSVALSLPRNLVRSILESLRAPGLPALWSPDFPPRKHPLRYPGAVASHCRSSKLPLILEYESQGISFRSKFLELSEANEGVQIFV